VSRAAGRPTLFDVAQRAGVSLKTASRALNGEYGVAPSTSARVQQAATDLGFRPNRLARSLAAGGPSAAVGLVLSSVSDPFFAAICGAVESLVVARDLQLLSASHGDDPERQLAIIRTFVERRVDALIVVPAPGDASYLRPELEHGVVVVAIDRPIEGLDVDTVVVDNVGGAREAVARLVARGHRRIAVAGDDPRLWTLRQRHLGFREGLAAAGLPDDPRLVALDCRDADGAADAIRRMLALADPPTALVAIQFVAGRGAARVVRESGAALEVAVFDEPIDTDLLADPPVLVVASAPERLGRCGAALAMERLDCPDGPSRQVVLPPVLHGTASR